MNCFVELMERGLKISVSSSRLMVSRERETISSIPLDEIEAVLITEPALALSGCLLAELGSRRIPVVICDGKYLPAAILQPMVREGSESNRMLPLQIQAKQNFHQKVWNALIRQKIAGQEFNLRYWRKSAISLVPPHLKSHARYEAEAAAKYWEALALFPRRDRNACDANRLFNYAYAVIYASFARHICAAGLEPHLGIHHHGQYNPFNLASDLMEPFRPLADQAVLRILKQFPHQTALTKEIKQELLQALLPRVLIFSGKKFRMADAIALCVHSYKKCLLESSASFLELPGVK